MHVYTHWSKPYWTPIQSTWGPLSLEMYGVSSWIINDLDIYLVFVLLAIVTAATIATCIIVSEESVYIHCLPICLLMCTVMCTVMFTDVLTHVEIGLDILHFPRISVWDLCDSDAMQGAPSTKPQAPRLGSWAPRRWNHLHRLIPKC